MSAWADLELHIAPYLKYSFAIFASSSVLVPATGSPLPHLYPGQGISVSIIAQAEKKRHPMGDSAFTKISAYSLTSSLTEAARPAMPWISLGMMILVA